MKAVLHFYGLLVPFGCGPQCFGDEARDRADAHMRMAWHFFGDLDSE